MGARANEGVAMVDFIIAELDKASKLDADTKSTLEGFRFSPAAAAPVAAAPDTAALLTLILSQSILSKIRG